MTPFPSTSAARPRRRSTAGAALGLLGVLMLTGCETSTAEQGGTPVPEPGTSNQGVQQQVPEPSGNQLTHDEMREQLASRYPDAALSDTTDYWAGLRDIETELQRLVVDPPECKQFVVRSAVPVPAGALVAYADGLAEGGSGDAGDSSRGGSDGGDEDSAETPEGDPEAGALDAEAHVQLASTEEEDSEGSDAENSDTEGGDSAGGDSGNSDSEGGDSEGSDSEGGDSEDSDSEEDEDPEPVTVDLPSQRQALILSFRDWRAADAHLAAEQDGLESCDSYTASRGGEDSVETSTSVDLIDVSSTADDALGTSSRITSDGDREDAVAVTLRSGSHIVTVTAPLSEALDEDEAEVAAEELQTEAADLIESLD